MVRAAGNETTLCHQNWILSPARLPVPPPLGAPSSTCSPNHPPIGQAPTRSRRIEPGAWGQRAQRSHVRKDSASFPSRLATQQGTGAPLLLATTGVRNKELRSLVLENVRHGVVPRFSEYLRSSIHAPKRSTRRRFPGTGRFRRGIGMRPIPYRIRRRSSSAHAAPGYPRLG